MIGENATGIGGVRLRYRIDGASGPWIAFSNSLGCTLEMWDGQVAALAGRYRILRYDTRGHGGSAAPPGPYTLEQLADDLVGLMDHLNIDRAVLVGLSMGGMLGQHALLRAPKRFSGAMLCDTTSHYGPEAAPRWADRIHLVLEQGLAPIAATAHERWFTPGFPERHPAIVRRYAEMAGGNDAQGYAACCAAIPQISVTERLPEIRVPVRVVVGKQDLSTTVEHAQHIVDNLPGSDLVVIDQAAHLSNVEQPEAFNRALIEFLDRIP
ncbi:MAG TPA: 3-oxoadipate enol-lactonase [Stellaceae bacterium]|nr:3-oxoadipate enol-lactonase [Stellaceae bacterium]